MRVAREHPVELGVRRRRVAEAALEQVRDARNAARIAAAEHDDVAVAAHGAAQIVHQLERPGLAREAPAEAGQVERHGGRPDVRRRGRAASRR